jgi:hypothetical protein
MTYPLKVFLLFALAGTLIAASPSCAHAQIAPPSAIAWTQCLDAKVSSYINASIIGTDSAAVILRHEEVHHRQQTDTIAVTGRCAIYVTPAQLLNAEIEAYCASDSVAVHVQARHPTEVSAQTLLRLMAQFHRALPAFTITDSWARGCPGETLP